MKINILSLLTVLSLTSAAAVPSSFKKKANIQKRSDGHKIEYLAMALDKKNGNISGGSYKWAEVDGKYVGEYSPTEDDKLAEASRKRKDKPSNQYSKSSKVPSKPVAYRSFSGLNLAVRDDVADDVADNVDLSIDDEENTTEDGQEDDSVDIADDVVDDVDLSIDDEENTTEDGQEDDSVDIADDVVDNVDLSIDDEENTTEDGQEDDSVDIADDVVDDVDLSIDDEENTTEDGQEDDSVDIADDEDNIDEADGISQVSILPLLIDDEYLLAGNTSSDQVMSINGSVNPDEQAFDATNTQVEAVSTSIVDNYSKNTSGSKRPSQGKQTNSKSKKNKGYTRINYKGKNWDSNGKCSSEFTKTLKYKPKNSYGNLFQFCYSYYPNFKNQWNKSSSFRSKWNTDKTCRDGWVKKAVSYTKAKKYST